jgi:NAD(P)-dependent dehydrogenase (short-subunit alcohol dehydrogenase family)
MTDGFLNVSTGRPIADSHCVVTGGGSGIGRATVLRFAGEGARVTVLDQNLESAEETAQLASAMAGKVAAVRCDVSDQSSVDQAKAFGISRFGACNVLVNNAAVLGRPGPIADYALNEWNRLISVNLTGCFICSRTFGADMVARKSGILIHVSSVAADLPIPSGGAYSVAKAGVSMLSKLLAVEWGPLGVRSNAVLPGFVYTQMASAAYADEAILARRRKAVPTGTIGRPEDIADAIAFLASPQASYINGAELAVDGGYGRNLIAMVPKLAT